MEFPRLGKSAGAAGLVMIAVLGVSPKMAEASVSTTLPSPALASSSASTAAGSGVARALGFKPTPAFEAAKFAGSVKPHSAFGANAVPASVDLTPYAPTPGDQGQVSSCVSWSVGYDLMGYYAKKTGHAGAPYAPMFLYSQVNGGVDQGSTFSDTFRVLNTQGIDTQANYKPQGDFGWRLKPTPAQKASAAFHRSLTPTLLFAGSGQGANARTILSNALAAGQPVVIGIAVYNNFFYLTSAKSTFKQSDVSGQLLGYHALTAFGYNASGLVIENSWGSGWGNRGFATLGWDFVQSGVIEAWTTAGFAAPVASVSVAPTAWASTGVGTPSTMTAESDSFGPSPVGFSALGWKLTIGGVAVPVSWRSSTQLAFTAPAGVVGAANIALTRNGAPALVTNVVNYVPSISSLLITQRADGSRLVTMNGAGLGNDGQWRLVAPSGAMSSLQTSAVNDIANGALNRVWVAPGGRIATALVGSVDSVLSEAGTYGLSYIAPSGFALMAWPSGGIPFVAPKISGLSLARVPGSSGADVTVFGDGLAAFLAARPAGVRLVSDVTGQSTELVVKSKTVRSVTISIAPGTVEGSYHLVVWTPLGVSISTANAAALTVLSPGLR